MANGWLPRNGAEWLRWMEAEMRIQRRHRHVNYQGEWPGAIDGSSGTDTTPIDYLPSSGSGFTAADTAPDGSLPSGGSTFLDVP